MNKKYTVEYYTECSSEDVEEFGESFHLGAEGKTVWSDGMEPEDATLYRDLKPLVDLLNKEAEEHARTKVLLEAVTKKWLEAGQKTTTIVNGNIKNSKM